MAIYSDQDISSTFEGDIEIGTNGDIKLSNSLETYKSAANFVLRTDYGDYVPDQDVGSNLGSFIGENNTERIHAAMEYNIDKALKNNIFSQTDISSTVVPFDYHEALAIIDIAGTYVIDGEYVQVDNERMTYSFPYVPEGDFSLTVI